MDQERLKRAYEGLPARRPRGDPANILRAFMFPYLLAGMSPEEARTKAMIKARALAVGIFIIDQEDRKNEPSD
jgi:hypothetical protein